MPGNSVTIGIAVNDNADCLSHPSRLICTSHLARREQSAKPPGGADPTRSSGELPAGLLQNGPALLAVPALPLGVEAGLAQFVAEGLRVRLVEHHAALRQVS